MTSRNRISRAGSPLAGASPRTSAPAGPIAGRRRLDRRRRRGGAVERPVQPAERDERGADRGLGEGDRLAELEPTVEGGVGHRPEHDAVGDQHQHEARRHRPLAQPGGLVLQAVQGGPPVDEPVDRPAGQAEQAQLLGGGRVDGQPVGVVGVALRAAHLVGVAIAPDGALPQQPVGGQPAAGQHEGRPPGEGEQHRRRRQAADHLDEAPRDEVHRDRQRRPGHAEVELASDGEVVAELGILEVADARRVDAGVGELVVEPGGGAVAEVVAHREVERREHLEQHEHDAHEGERAAERVVGVHRTHERAHRHREGRRQQAPQQRGSPTRGWRGRGRRARAPGPGATPAALAVVPPVASRARTLRARPTSSRVALLRRGSGGRRRRTAPAPRPSGSGRRR